MIPVQPSSVIADAAVDLDLNVPYLADVVFDIGVIKKAAVVRRFALEAEKSVEVLVRLLALQKSVFSFNAFAKYGAFVHYPSLRPHNLPAGEILSVKQRNPG